VKCAHFSKPGFCCYSAMEALVQGNVVYLSNQTSDAARDEGLYCRLRCRKWLALAYPFYSSKGLLCPFEPL